MEEARNHFKGMLSKGGRTYYLVKCGCGERHVRTDSSSAYRPFCGRCLKRNPNYKTRAYTAWDSMLQRCYNPKASSFHKYGAVGILVCNRWVPKAGGSFNNFLEDMGACPEGLTLDRINGELGYSPENCRWASTSLQGYNQKRRCTNTTGRTGVCYDTPRDKWVASITVDNKTIGRKRFDTFDEAVAHRITLEQKYFGFIKE